jgi:tetratricopeptide (TPR) repeat protein/tRNA A-37 threonylcarbamoyl transferase component Bud32
MAAFDRQRVKDLFLAALELRPGDRAPFLDIECAGQPELRAEVESLLAASDEATGFLESPAPLMAFAEMGPELPATPVDTLAGARLGPYVLDSAIGEGGMGTVYRASRVDQTFEQTVAIKVLHRDLGRGAMLRRFQAERKILASLEHPYIARLLDAGESPDGRSYLVLEYIDGKPLNVYADEADLSVRQRLELFRHICAAVQSAHQRLVVHRDLKPANILVTADGVPKLLDFGIAKLLDETDADRTATGMHLMTPAYASPEQVRGELITTSSDIYSLGVLLFELLTGAKPLKLPTGDPLAVAQIISHQDPPPPSNLVPDLAGDLDNIVLKALAKEPERRYGSVADFSEDVRRYLEGLPVAARTPKLFYIVQKFVRRHPGRLASAALVLVTLAGGVYSTMREGRRAEARFNDVRALSNSVLFEIHDAIQPLPGSTAARELVLSRALTFLDKLSAEASGDVTLQKELANGYMRLASVQGERGASNLGRNVAARASLLKALALRQAVVQALPNDAAAQRDLANTHDDLAASFEDQANKQEAAQHQQVAFALRQKIAATFPQELAKSYFAQAQSRVTAADFAGALELHRQAVALWDQAAGPNSQQFLRSRSIGHKRMGGLLIRLGRLEEAQQHYETALQLDAMRLQISPADLEAKLDMSFAHSDLALIWQQRNNLPRALDSARKALQAREAVMAADPSNERARYSVANSLARVASILWKLNQRTESIALYERALAVRTESAREGSPSIDDLARRAELLGQLGAAYAETARLEKARGHLQDAITLLGKVRAAWPDRQEFGDEVTELQAILAKVEKK